MHAACSWRGKGELGMRLCTRNFQWLVRLQFGSCLLGHAGGPSMGVRFFKFSIRKKVYFHEYSDVVLPFKRYCIDPNYS